MDENTPKPDLHKAAALLKQAIAEVRQQYQTEGVDERSVSWANKVDEAKQRYQQLGGVVEFRDAIIVDFWEAAAAGD